MKRNVVFLLLTLCLLFCSSVVQAQKPKNPQKIVVRMSRVIDGLQPKVKVFPPYTPKTIIKEFKADKNSIYLERTLPRHIQNGDLMTIHLEYLHQRDGHGPFKAQQIIYDETVENAALFEYENLQNPQRILDEQYKLSIYINQETRAILTDEFQVEEAYVKQKKRGGKSKDFVFKDSVIYKDCINNFTDFLKQLNQNVDEEFEVSSVLKNKINQALFSFYKRWEEQKVVSGYNAPVCVRFLKESGVKVVCQIDTYTNWLRGAYKKWETRGEEHYDHAIDSLVEEWFLTHPIMTED